jgi:hypothetical protein
MYTVCSCLCRRVRHLSSGKLYKALIRGPIWDDPLRTDISERDGKGEIAMGKRRTHAKSHAGKRKNAVCLFSLASYVAEKTHGDGRPRKGHLLKGVVEKTFLTQMRRSV